MNKPNLQPTHYKHVDCDKALIEGRLDDACNGCKSALWHSPQPILDKTCKHTEGPAGYVARSDWLERMAKRYNQLKCANCGLWAIWRKK